MSLNLVHLPNGRTSATGPLRLLSRFLTGPGIVQPTAFAVTASTPTVDMNVNVAGSIAGNDIVIQDDSGNIYHGWNTTSVPVTISANNSGVTKTDLLVAYADTTLVTTNPDNPGGLVLKVVRRGTNLTGVPITSEILTQTNNQPWEPLAEITVGNGVGSINSGNIVDRRHTARIDGAFLKSGSVDTSQLADAAVHSRNFKPYMDKVEASAALNLTTSAQDITGATATFTLDVASTVFVTGIFDFDASLSTHGNAGDTCLGSLIVDGSAQGEVATLSFYGATARQTAPQQWKLTLAAGSHTIKLRAQNVTGARGGVNQTHTSLLYQAISQ